MGGILFPKGRRTGNCRVLTRDPGATNAAHDEALPEFPAGKHRTVKLG